MKKSIILVSIFCILILIQSCSTKNGTSNIQENQLIPILDSVPISEIVLFNGQKLYYFIDDINTETPDLANKSLFEYDLKSNKTIKIDTFSNISVSSGSKAMNQKNIYMHMATNVQNSIIKIDKSKYSAETIKKWSTFPPLAYLYLTDNSLIIFGPDDYESGVNYYINNYSLNDNREKNIITKKIENQKGELIACIDVDKECIYAFSILSDGRNENYRIIQYDMNGEQSAIYPFDLSLYLSEDTLDSEDDAIIKIYKEKDYFILNTINGRVFIFKMNNSTLKPVQIPEKFYQNNPNGYHFLDYYDGDSDYAYFINTFNNNSIIEAFNYQTEEFYSFCLPTDNNYLYSYFRDANGDLVVERYNKKDNSQSQYYYIKSPFQD